MNEEEMLKIFGENVRKQREKENLTLKDVAEKTKIREFRPLLKVKNKQVDTLLSETFFSSLYFTSHF